MPTTTPRRRIHGPSLPTLAMPRSASQLVSAAPAARTTNTHADKGEGAREEIRIVATDRSVREICDEVLQRSHARRLKPLQAPADGQPVVSADGVSVASH